MIKCNLAVLLAERNIKISDMSRETGISRTTLTSIYYNTSKGIQFDTLEAICDYLNVEPADVIKKINFKYKIIYKEINDSIGKIEYTILFTYGDKKYEGQVELLLLGPELHELYKNDYSEMDMTIDVSYGNELKQNIFSQITETVEENLISALQDDFIETLHLEQHKVTTVTIDAIDV